MIDTTTAQSGPLANSQKAESPRLYYPAPGRCLIVLGDQSLALTWDQLLALHDLVHWEIAR